MSRKFLWIIALMCSFLLSQLALAQTSICKASLNKMVESLNLDDTQKAKINPIIGQLKSHLKSLGSQMDGIEEQINQQVYSTNIDQDKVNALVDKKTNLIGEMMKAKAIATNQIFTILNPQQKQQLQSMITTAERRIANTFKSCFED